MKKQHVDLQAVCRELLAKKSFPAAVEAFAARLANDGPLRHAVATATLVKEAGTEARRVPARRREGPKRSSRTAKSGGMPTIEQKIGALKAERNYVVNIFDRKLRGGIKLGDVCVHELHAISEASAAAGVGFVHRGYEDIVEMFVCAALSKHCVSSDPFAKVRDVIKPQVATRAFERAQINAAEALHDGSGRLVRELIAAAQKQIDGPGASA